MASASSLAPAPIRFSLRVLEWGLLAIVVLAVVLLFLRHAREVRGQAEFAAIRSTLGALRTAFVFGHLKARTAGPQASVAVVQRNPFGLLQRRPANYLGEISAAEAAAAVPGSWLFEPECACVGYLPIDPQWLASANGAMTLWFRVIAGPGPLQLVAMDAYLWQGQVLD